MPQSIVLYRGPSMLDGAPIVVLASVGSSNVKTGSLIQTWIMRADLNPSAASAAKADSSVCGSCPRRHSLGGDCYVQLIHAPRSVWQAWERRGKPGVNWTEPSQRKRLQRDARAYGLRLGSYGDPAAVPWHVWQGLIDALQPATVVGYTHQWRDAWLDGAHASWCRTHLMASVDSVSEALIARARGWRFFLAIGASEAQSLAFDRVIECPATTMAEKRCEDCGACDGAARGSWKPSVFLAEHGMRSQSKAKRVAALAVLQ